MSTRARQILLLRPYYGFPVPSFRTPKFEKDFLREDMIVYQHPRKRSLIEELYAKNVIS